MVISNVLIDQLYSGCVCVCVCMLSHVQLFAIPWTVAHQAPLSMEFFQARIPEWVAISSSRESSQPSIQTPISWVSCIGRWILYHCATWGVPLQWLQWKKWVSELLKITLTWILRQVYEIPSHKSKKSKHFSPKEVAFTVGSNNHYCYLII